MKVKKASSIANKVYRKYIEGTDETALKDRIKEMSDLITVEVFSMERLNDAIEETFKAIYCPDITKYEMAKICRCERFIEYINNRIDEAIKKRKSFTLRYVDFMDVINVGENENNLNTDAGGLVVRSLADQGETLVSANMYEEEVLSIPAVWGIRNVLNYKWVLIGIAGVLIIVGCIPRKKNQKEEELIAAAGA
ncbi:hypothetical protein SAMN04487928_101115 [Butyrivibrio proteoclasticus]|uniref:Uncharacterized protein n=1 Tax=Butyrivibrio proteoclasticus TaxID=43305 RepID=A0A1I5PR96_9FIRM|nr:hypothetical protein [Butyrivibrio proteoclasticus]SFP36662.1 hypothetical protein SAMN04487928_101115 [Butyrivibrio proteoclasticus]